MHECPCFVVGTAERQAPGHAEEESISTEAGGLRYVLHGTYLIFLLMLLAAL